MDIKPYQYYRNRLDAHDQAIYDELLDQWMHMPESIELSNPHVNIGTITHAIKMDIPLLFYLHFWYIPLETCDKGVKLVPSYLFDKEQARKNLAKVERWSANVLNKMPNDLDELSKALWLRDVIILNCVYGDNKNYESHTMYGVAVNKVAVCEGIAATYKFLCDLVGIRCISVNGKLVEEGHSWNVIWIDGEPSFVDVTSDLRDGTGTCRNNFLRAAYEMPDYEWDAKEVPFCRLRNLSSPFFRVSCEKEMLEAIHNHLDSHSIILFLDYPQAKSFAYRKNLMSQLYCRPEIAQHWILNTSAKRAILYLDYPDR